MKNSASTPYYAPIPAPTLLYYLMQERPAVEKLAKLDKVYEPLLRLLLTLLPSKKLPTGKALQQQLRISQAVYGGSWIVGRKIF